MKARVKATGKIVCIERNLGYPGGYVASDGKIYNACDLELIVDEDPDYWTRLEHQYAGMAMQGLVTRGEVLGSSVQEIARDIAEISCEVAHALVEKLKSSDL